MNYDPASNDLLRAANRYPTAGHWIGAVAYGVAIGLIWYLAVAIRAGAL